MDKQVWWVENDTDHYETGIIAASPKFSSEALAIAWMEREEQLAYDSRLERHDRLLADFERADTENGELRQRFEKGNMRWSWPEQLEFIRDQHRRLKSMDLQTWLTDSRDIVVGGWGNHYRVANEEVFDELWTGKVIGR